MWPASVLLNLVDSLSLSPFLSQYTVHVPICACFFFLVNCCVLLQILYLHKDASICISVGVCISIYVGQFWQRQRGTCEARSWRVAHPSHSPMPDWECGNVSSDTMLPAGPVRTGKAIQKKQDETMEMGKLKQWQSTMHYCAMCYNVVSKLRL